MGLTYVRVRICNPADREKTQDLELLVDSGAIYSVVREDKLRGLDIKPEGKRKFKTADGRLIEREFGVATVEYKGERAGTVVIFGKVDDTEVLGVHALEGLGLELDPVTKELRPMTLLLV
jgi:clan AA aspartic protease